MALNLSEAITRLVDEMKFLGVWAGVAEKRFDDIKVYIARDDTSVDDLESLWLHLSKLKRTRWKALYDIRYAMHIVNDGIWDVYASMGRDANLITEVRLFKKAAHEFRKAFRWSKPKDSEPSDEGSKAGPE